MSLRTNLAVVSLDDHRLAMASNQVRRRGVLAAYLMAVESMPNAEQTSAKGPTAASLALATELIARYRNVAAERRPLLVRDVASVFDDYADVASAVCDASIKQSIPRRMPDRWSPSTLEIEKVCSAFRKAKFPDQRPTDQAEPLVYPAAWREVMKRCDGYHAIAGDASAEEYGRGGRRWALRMLEISDVYDKRAHDAAKAVLADQSSSHSEKTRAGMLLAKVRDAIAAANASPF